MANLREIHALVVGGGATARIIGRALVKAGVHVALLLKPEFAAIADQGFELHKLLTLKKKRERHRYDDFRILTDPDQLSHNHFDQIYICVSGADLRTGWLERAWPHLRHSIWVSFQPGVDDRAYLRGIIPDRYLVQGTIGFIAYHAPLPSERINPPGVAFWFPPGQITMISATDEKVAAVVTNILSKGGLPTGNTTGFEAYRLYRSAAVVPAAATLEIHGWSFERLREDRKAIARLCVAIAEAGGAIEARTGRTDSMNGWLRKPWFWRLLLKRLNGLTPMPLDEYLQRHFTKLRAQTEQQLGGFIGMTQASGRQPAALTAIAKEWVRVRPQVDKVRRDVLASDGMVAKTSERSEFSRTGSIGGEAKGRAREEAARVGRPTTEGALDPSQLSNTASQSGNLPAAQQPIRSGQSGNFPAAQQPMQPGQSGNFPAHQNQHPHGSGSFPNPMPQQQQQQQPHGSGSFPNPIPQGPGQQQRRDDRTQPTPVRDPNQSHE